MLLACLLLALAATAAGSPGDQSPAFRRCHSVCTRTGCTSTPPAAATAAGDGSSRPLQPGGGQQCSPLCGGSSSSTGSGTAAAPAPLAQRLWRWDCAADCSYLCMWVLEGQRPAGAAVRKYFGKWPFARWGGMQEPASVLFSLLNLAAHAHCLARFWRLRLRLRGTAAAAGPAAAKAALAVDGTSSSGSGSSLAAAGAEAYPYAWLWAGYMLLSMNAWLWSAVFHSRDTRLTERLDYFSAALLIFFNLFLSLVRTLRLQSAHALAAAAAPLAFFLASHFRFMLYVLFDYGYHVKVCIAAGAAQSLLWVGWAAATAPPARRQLYTFVLLVNACMLLEVLDFPPLLHASLDAHALWHLATVPLVYFFYRFIISDITAAAAPAPGLSLGAGAEAVAMGKYKRG